MASSRSAALAAFAAATSAIVLGVAIAMARYPGGFDWAYTVISRLASRKHNAEGGAWVSGGLLVGLLLLWPTLAHLRRMVPTRLGRMSVGALRVGLVGGAMLAVEGLLMIDLSVITRKAHEVLALVTLLALYGGVLGLYAERIRRKAAFAWPALLVVGPLVAIGASQLFLYFDQRELGWVDTAWREMGVPIWLSFAFWQWLAVAVLGMGFGHLIATAASDSSEPGSGPAPDPTACVTATAAPAALNPP